MTYAQWLDLVKQAGANVQGVDPNWLNQQFAQGMSPVVVARQLQASAAQYVPPNAVQPLNLVSSTQTTPNGNSFNLGFFGGLGIVAGVIAGCSGLFFLMCGGCFSPSIPSKNEPTTNPSKTTNSSPRKETPLQPSNKATEDSQKWNEWVAFCKSNDLDPNVEYPFWPLVYHKDFSFGNSHIRGKVTNYGSRAVRNVMITFSLKDHWGNRVGDAWDMINDLSQGETWQYDCYVFERGAEKCSLRSIRFY